MKTTKISFISFAGCIVLTALYGLSSNAQTTRDIDGNGYRTVKIGQKAWMAENLTVSRFRNGDPVPQAKSPEEWALANQSGKPAWCYYKNSDSIGAIYGKLYNWFALTDPRGLAPEGWHMPTNADWTAATKFLGGVDVAGIKMKNAGGWSKKSIGNNKSGFSALPGGIRNETGQFSDLNRLGQWWSVSKTIRFPQQAYSLKLQEAYVEVFYEAKDKGCGLYVRAVKD